MGAAQMSMAAWLIVAVAAGTMNAARPARRRTIWLTPERQRLASAGFAASAAIEALTLWLGGFWHG